MTKENMRLCSNKLETIKPGKKSWMHRKGRRVNVSGKLKQQLSRYKKPKLIVGEVDYEAAGLPKLVKIHSVEDWEDQ